MSVDAPAVTTGPRVKPSVGAGLVLYVGYLAIFYTTWKINDVDYPTIGKTLESTKLHYAYPTLFGCAFLVVALTVMGWWKITLFDRVRSGPKWAWIGPIAMFLLAAGAFAAMETEKATSELVLWSILGGIGVGFGEEMITRGGLLVGLRAQHTEHQAWLWSTIAFSALHAPNALFGQSVPSTLGQLVLTFIVGSLLYSIRRVSGTLLLAMFLHGFWDSSIFLPNATDSKAFPLQTVVYIIAIITIIGVLRYQKHHPEVTERLAG